MKISLQQIIVGLLIATTFPAFSDSMTALTKTVCIQNYGSTTFQIVGFGNNVELKPSKIIKLQDVPITKGSIIEIEAFPPTGKGSAIPIQQLDIGGSQIQLYMLPTVPDTCFSQPNCEGFKVVQSGAECSL